MLTSFSLTLSTSKNKQRIGSTYAVVTRLGDLLHFGQLLKACDNNYFAEIFRQFL